MPSVTSKSERSLECMQALVPAMVSLASKLHAGLDGHRVFWYLVFCGIRITTLYLHWQARRASEITVPASDECRADRGWSRVGSPWGSRIRVIGRASREHGGAQECAALNCSTQKGLGEGRKERHIRNGLGRSPRKPVVGLEQ